MKAQPWLLGSLPAIGEMMLHTLVWFTDTAVVGRLGANEISAVGLGAQIYFTLTFVMGCIGMGTTALVARAWGDGDTRKASQVVGRAVFLALAVGLTLTALLLLGVPFLFGLTDLPPAVCSLGVGYVRLVCLGAVFLLLQSACNAGLRGSGDTRTPMVIAGVANVLNVAGDVVLVFGLLGFPALGVLGAAAASLAAQVTGGLLSLLALVYRRPELRFSWRAVTVDRILSRKLVGVSVPTGLENLLMDGARMVSAYLLTALGSTAFASSQVAIAAESLAFMPGYGFAIAASVAAGQGLGAGRPGRARREVGQALFMGSLFALGMTVLFLAIPRPIVGLFTTVPAVAGLAASCLWIAAFAQPFMMGAEVFLGAMRGAGDTRSAMLITACTVWTVRVPLTFYLIYLKHYPITVAWWVMVLEWVLRTVVAALVYRSGKWQRVKL